MKSQDKKKTSEIFEGVNSTLHQAFIGAVERDKPKKPDKWYKEYGVCKELAQLRGYPEPKELEFPKDISQYSQDTELIKKIRGIVHGSFVVESESLCVSEIFGFIKQILTQQRTELKCEDCSLEDKHIIPTDRSTTRISRHCAGEDIQTIAGTLLKSKEWKEWYKYSSENMLFDVDETETVDMMSNEHFNSFIEFTKNKVRSELLEEILELLLIKGPIGGFENSFNNRIKEVFNNLIDKKNE